MHLVASSLDDILYQVFKRLCGTKSRNTATRGSTKEVIGAYLKLTNPRARLSSTEGRGRLFSALGEFLWYLSGDDTLKFIEYYVPRYGQDNSDDGITTFGAYGPRLLNMRGQNQLENVANLLRSKPRSRRAVIQLFNAEDIAVQHKEIPCTCTIQFLLRDGHLHTISHLRSNDAFLGLPHDIFSFTMMQELIARRLDADLGLDQAKPYLAES